MSSNSRLVANVQRYTDHGAVRFNERPDWNHEDADIGDNLRMSEVHAAILRSQLKRMNTLLRIQKDTRDAVLKVVADWPLPIVRSLDPAGDTGAFLVFQTHNADDTNLWIRAASHVKILMRLFWACPFYELNSIRKAYRAGPNSLQIECPRASDLAPRLLALPLPPLLKGRNLKIFLHALEQVPVILKK